MRGRIKILTPRLFLIFVINLFFLACLGLAFLPGANRPAITQSIEDCQACHEEVVKAFSRTVHQKENCAVCHSGAAKHIEEGTKESIFSFTANETVAAKTKPCLACHQADAGHYASSPHGKGGLDCTACHTIHQSLNETSVTSATSTKVCASCHQDVLTEFNLNERHRLREGILECTSCHNPHEPATREQLAGFKQEACLKCHVEKGGPYLYEHAASRIEGCTACHTPHGSPNRHLLTQQSISDLCFSCHSTAPAWHSRFTSTTTNCTTCHLAIHGSNLSRLFLK